LFQSGGRIIALRSLLTYAAVVLGALAFGASAALDPLAAKVSIYRDDFDVPHIVGETEEATFFGYGYVQAQDHLEHMMLEYRDAQGRRAEGEMNVVVRSGVFPLDGTNTFGVLHPDEGPEQEDGRIFCNDGWAHLMVVMEGERKQIWSLLPYGESEQPSSPHYNDQTKLHSARKLKRFWFTPSEILDHTESTWGDKDRIKHLLK
jgi:acyl-homoserine lactone acylase PvdQ